MYFFTWNVAERYMIACHSLTVNKSISYVVQRRRKQLPEKIKVVERFFFYTTIKDLFKVDYITKTKYYTICMFNVVPVIKQIFSPYRFIRNSLKKLHIPKKYIINLILL
jgi:hypothetical protein